MPNHLPLWQGGEGGEAAGERAARLLGSRSPPTPCVPFAEEFQPYTKSKAISDDGFASSSQLPGYDRIPGRREGIHVEGWGSPPSPRPPHAPSGGVPLVQTGGVRAQAPVQHREPNSPQMRVLPPPPNQSRRRGVRHVW